MLHARVAGYDAVVVATCCTSGARCSRRTTRASRFVLTERVPVVPRAVEPANAAAVLAENAEVAEHVLERIRADGPLSALDFERERGATVDWFGVPTNVVRAVLEAYAVTGVLGLARRDGNRRYYDLLERLLPARRARARRAAEGAAPAQAPVAVPRARPPRRRRRRRHLRRPRPREARPALAGHPGRTALREELIADGELVPVEVEGVRGKRFVLREEVELLACAAGAAGVRRVPLAVRSAGVGPRPPRVPVRLRLRVGALLPAGQASLRLVRAADPLPRPLRRPHRAADRPRRAGACRCSASGGRTASRRDAPTASSTRCARRCAPISASPAPTASSGRRTSARRGGSSSLARRRREGQRRSSRPAPTRTSGVWRWQLL